MNVQAQELDIEAQLAQANLLRIRGDYGGAEDLALSILKRDPDSVTGHTLLGDINVEKGDLAQAEQWYELALDLDPGSTGDRKKLEAVRRRLADAEALQTAERLGLPKAKNNLFAALAALVVFVLLVGVLAYLLGRQWQQSQDTKTITETFSAPPVEAPKAVAAQPVIPEAPVAPAQDRQVLAAAAEAAGNEGNRILSVVTDPRNRLAMVTINLDAATDDTLTTATIARATLQSNPELAVVTVRGVRGGEVMMVADATRQRLDEISEPTWAEQNGGDPNAWAAALLERGWTPAPANPPSSP